MRILVLNYEFPPVGGGGGMVSRDISLGLARRGHEINVITAHFSNLPREENLHGVKVLRIPSLRRSPFQAGLLAMAGYVAAGGWAAWSHIRRWTPDLIHVHFAVPSGPIAWSLKRLTGIPYVLTVHLGDVPAGVPKKTQAWFRWIYPFTPPIWRDAAQVVAVSSFTRQLALKRYAVDVQVIPNGANLEEMSPGEIGVHNPPLIVFAGRFASQKNPVQVVRTLAEIKHLPWRCLMMGDGPLQAAVENEIQRTGLEDRFTLPGWVTPEEVIRRFADADILFMPSLSEGLPVIGLKALSMGLSIVASGVGGFIDLVDPGVNGYLIQPDCPSGYANALKELLTAPERLLDFRKASRKKAADFDLERVVDGYEQLFNSILNHDQVHR